MRARRAFLWACALDVATFKPGNVSIDASGHGMQAAQFVASADAAAGPLFDPALAVGERIEAAMLATLAVAGCNTNLGIVLLVAPLARAIEGADPAAGAAALREALHGVLAGLDLADARAAYRAIALTRPGGLGQVAEHDVREPPSIGLREAMALAAHRDRIAAQYTNGYGDVFDAGLDAFHRGLGAARGAPSVAGVAVRQAMLHTYLELLSLHLDSHIARQHGDTLAHTVMTQAGAWLSRLRDGVDLRADSGFRAWDLDLKAAQVNPGTTADLCVAVAVVAGWLDTSLVGVVLEVQ